MARKKNVPNVPPAEAVYVIEAMIGDGRIDSETLKVYRGRYRDEIRSLEARIARLKDLGAAPAAAAMTAAVTAAAATIASSVVRRRRRHAKPGNVAVSSAERQKTRQLQGRYLVLIRQIPKQVVAKRFGREAIAKDGKESVIRAMEQYVARGRK